MNEITIGETCFFRNQPQLDAIRQIVLPRIVEARSKLPLRHLRIWSAGCSTGEEPIYMANSPLFGRWQPVDSVRGAVLALGMQRMREIATSCCVLKLSPNINASLDPVVFWEHSFGCALVCRRFAIAIGFPDADKAYLAGLLHDIGILVNLWVLSDDYTPALELARTQSIPLDEAEFSTLGITHCDSGRMLAARWNFSPDIVEAIGSHHDPSIAASHRDLVALVCLSDLLCRMSGLGHGQVEARQVDLVEQAGMDLLLAECPALQTFDWARFTFELEAYMEEVHRLVSALYRPQ